MIVYEGRDFCFLRGDHPYYTTLLQPSTCLFVLVSLLLWPARPLPSHGLLPTLEWTLVRWQSATLSSNDRIQAQMSAHSTQTTRVLCHTTPSTLTVVRSMAHQVSKFVPTTLCLLRATLPTLGRLLARTTFVDLAQVW